LAGSGRCKKERIRGLKGENNNKKRGNQSLQLDVVTVDKPCWRVAHYPFKAVSMIFTQTEEFSNSCSVLSSRLMAQPVLNVVGFGNPLLDISVVADQAFFDKYKIQPATATLAEAKDMPMYKHST
jgi:hypothetical protein